MNTRDKLDIILVVIAITLWGVNGILWHPIASSIALCIMLLLVYMRFVIP
jgi:hypothetical protein